MRSQKRLQKSPGREIESRGTISLAAGRRALRVVDSSRTTGRGSQSGKDARSLIKAADSTDATREPLSTYAGPTPRKRPGIYPILPSGRIASRQSPFANGSNSLGSWIGTQAIQGTCRAGPRQWRHGIYCLVIVIARYRPPIPSIRINMRRSKEQICKESQIFDIFTGAAGSCASEAWISLFTTPH